MNDLSKIIREELEKIRLHEECRPQHSFQDERAWEDYIKKYPTDFWENQILFADQSFGFDEIPFHPDMPF